MKNINGEDKIWLRIVIPINIPKDSIVFKVVKEAIDSILPPDVYFDIVALAQGSDCIESRYQLEENVIPVIELVKQSEKQGVDGVFVSDMDMCGVEAAREVVGIPVIGGFRANAYTAMYLGQTFSIITITKSIVAYQLEHLRAFDISGNFASIHVSDIPVSELIESFTDEGKRKDIIEKTTDLAYQAVNENGASSIIFGCAGFVGFADSIHDRLIEKYEIDIPVLAPNKVSFLYLYNLVKNKLSQSRITYSKVDS